MTSLKKSTLIRSFFAVELNDEWQKAALKAIRILQKKSYSDHVKWERPEKLHLTLRFLGSIPEDKINNIAQQLLRAIVKIEKLKIPYAKIFTFPQDHPRVIAVHFHLNDELTNLVKKIEEVVVNSELPSENHVFLPHVTLGRIRKLPAPVTENISFDFPEHLPINEIVLFRSDADENGSHYSVIQRFLLTA